MVKRKEAENLINAQSLKPELGSFYYFQPMPQIKQE